MRIVCDGGMRSRSYLALLAVLSCGPASAQTEILLPADGELAGYCLGANRQFVERFRKMQLWGCGKSPGMAWCREAKASAPEAMRSRERLVIHFARFLSDKGLLEADQPAAIRERLTQVVIDGSTDVTQCFNDKGAKDEAACERLQRCAAAERLGGS